MSKTKLLSFSDLSPELKNKIKNCFRWNYSETSKQCKICKRKEYCQELDK